MKNIITFAVFSLFFLPNFVHAGPIIRGGDNITVDASQVLKGDFYGFASSVDISGVAEDDMYVGGGKVTINATTDHDLTIVGGTVQVHGEVKDDLRVIGGDVVLGTPVHGDVVVVGGTLTILSTASVDGDVLFWGGTLIIGGPVTGSVHGESDELQINAPVGGDVAFTVKGPFRLGDNSHVMGDVTYTSSSDLVQAQDSSVEGTVRRITSSVDTSVRTILTSILYLVVLLAFSSLIFFFIAKRQVSGCISTSLVTPGVFGLIGLGVCIIIPVVSLVLIVSGIGVIVGVALLLGYGAVIVVSSTLGILYVGGIFEKIILKKSEVTAYTAIIGSCILVALSFIPTAFLFVTFAVTMISLGAVVYHTYITLKE